MLYLAIVGFLGALLVTYGLDIAIARLAGFAFLERHWYLGSSADACG